MNFSAHVQYDDWTGTGAADAADPDDIRSFAVRKGLLTDDEFLVGFEFYSGAKSSIEPRYFAVRIFVIEAGNYDGAVQEIAKRHPIPVHVRDLDVGLDEFFDFFKRFNVVLTQRGLGLGNREYEKVGG